MSPKPFNILFLNSIEKSVWGGLENWMELVGSGLAARKHKIFLAGREGSLFLDRISRHAEFEVIPLNISGDFNPITVRRLAAIAKSHRIDIVLCNFVKDVRLAGLARKITRNFKIMWTPGVNLTKKSISHRLLFSGFVDGVVVPSRYLRDEIIESGSIGKSRFQVIPVGLNRDYWTLDRIHCRTELLNRFNLPPESFICLTSGRFVPQKGHKYLVEAARDICRKVGVVRFLFLGDGPLENNLKEQINKFDLESHFIFAGLLRDHRQLVFGADLYVHPAVIEPYGIVLVEAMAASLPIVATRVGGVPEVVPENETAILVDPADRSQLTTAIMTMYNDHDLRTRMGRAGRERFESMYSLDSMLNKIEELLVAIAR